MKSVRGTHRYKDKALKHVVDWQPAGTEFDVAKIVKHGDTTRIQLANGLLSVATKRLTSSLNESIIKTIPVCFRFKKGAHSVRGGRLFVYVVSEYATACIGNMAK
ncbi:hypothetical protein [Levilactobacillus brevis]|uniref:hypothetical protein n=1 Tax=Levilactobacillus brevis TaxID=1580 RepID=UPI001CDB84BC|nr:hypothetical protein [Levilactobacillus brevis]